MPRPSNAFTPIGPRVLVDIFSAFVVAVMTVPEHGVSGDLHAEARHVFLFPEWRALRAGRGECCALTAPTDDPQLAQDVVVRFHSSTRLSSALLISTVASAGSADFFLSHAMWPRIQCAGSDLPDDSSRTDLALAMSIPQAFRREAAVLRASFGELVMIWTARSKNCFSRSGGAAAPSDSSPICWILSFVESFFCSVVFSGRGVCGSGKSAVSVFSVSGRFLLEMMYFTSPNDPSTRDCSRLA